MKHVKINNKYDYGELCLAKQSFSDYLFEVCGLSLGTAKRAVFEDCVFTRIKIKKCSVGFPIFRRCHFQDITSNLDGVLVYGAAFSECVFSGSLRNVVIGFEYDGVPLFEKDKEQGKKFHEENLALARTSGFAIDLTNAVMEHVAITGEEIVPYVRCSRNQALILKAKDLFEKLRHLGRAEKNRAIGDFFLGTGALPGCRAAIAIVNNAARECLAEIEDRLRRHDIEVSHF